MNNDQKIKHLLQKVTEQRNALGEKPKAAWRTNGIFKYTAGNHFNLNTITEKSFLVDALASLLELSSQRKSAFDILGVPYSEFVYNGYTIQEYIEDFKLRCSIIDWEEKKKLLTETEKKLKSLVSEEARTEMELESLSKLLE